MNRISGKKVCFFFKKKSRLSVILLDYTLYSDISQNSLISFSEMQNNAYVNITVAARSGATQHLSKYSPNKQNYTPKNSQKSVGLPQTPKPITRTCNQFQSKHSILREELLPARDAQSKVQSTQSPPSTPPLTSTERQPDGTRCLALSQTGPVPPTIKANLTAEAKNTKPSLSQPSACTSNGQKQKQFEFEKPFQRRRVCALFG